MDQSELEILTDIIIADYIPFIFNNITYSISSPSRQSNIIAGEIFFEYYYKAIEEGILDTDGVYKLLEKYHIWNNEKEVIFRKLQKDEEDMKVAVFENYLDNGKRIAIKQAILINKNLMGKMSQEKHSLDYLGAEFVGNYAKYQVLLGYSICRNGKYLWKSMKRWELPDEMTNIINKKLNRYKLNSEQYRELANCDYWRGIYNIRRGSLFKRPIVDYSDSQRQLLSWSQTYDNIYKSPDCPPQSIIDDCDAIDGWFIMQRRKRDRELSNTTIEGGMSEKIRNSEHVFVVTQPEDVDKVYNLNDVGGKIALHQRLTQIKKQEIVKEANMIDTRQMIQAKAFELTKGA